MVTTVGDFISSVPWVLAYSLDVFSLDGGFMVVVTLLVSVVSSTLAVCSLGCPGVGPVFSESLKC